MEKCVIVKIKYLVVKNKKLKKIICMDFVSLFFCLIDNLLIIFYVLVRL